VNKHKLPGKSLYNTLSKLVSSKAQFEAQLDQDVLYRLLSHSDESREASTSLEEHMLNLVLLKIYEQNVWFSKEFLDLSSWNSNVKELINMTDTGESLKILIEERLVGNGFGYFKAIFQTT
jgi:hypothetical protein